MVLQAFAIQPFFASNCVSNFSEKRLYVLDCDGGMIKPVV